jgi:drug/metabolite transporter (DMT)-like permease
LTYTSPLYLIGLSYWFLGERPKRADWGAMVAIFAGMILFLGDDLGFDSVRGNLFGILCGLSMAVLTLCMRGQKSGAPANTILLGNLLGGLIGLPFLLSEQFTLADTSIIIYLGLFQMGLSFVYYSIAIRHVPAVESMLILTLEPILSPIWVFLILGEMPGPLALVGAILVIGAVIVRAWISTYTPPEPVQATTP